MPPTNFSWHRAAAENYRWKIVKSTFADGSPAYIVKYGTVDYHRARTYEECETWLKNYLTE